LKLWSPSWTLVSGECAQKIGERGGWLAAFSLGIVFALAFCPTSAALFLGGLIPLIITHQQPVLLSLPYGLGTAAPVVVFAVLLVVATEKAGRAFQRITAVEPVFRIITGLVFFGVGLWYVAVVVFIPST
jgi:cytochrome c biogenesis protein CcdA